VAGAGRPATVAVEHPTIGRLELVGPPLRGGLRAPEAPPLLGEHTAEVLRELGRSDAELAELAARGAVQLAEGA
jgi:crotonobetainyl-CoA:carnitine CoA-transferase CaiB-like acyl-CoA transferase